MTTHETFHRGLLLAATLVISGIAWLAIFFRWTIDRESIPAATYREKEDAVRAIDGDHRDPEASYITTASSSPFTQRLEEIRSILGEGARPAEAEVKARLLLQEAEEVAERWPQDFADVRDLLVRALYLNGKRRQPETLALAELAVREREAWLGPRHPSLAFGLLNYGKLLQTNLRFAEARQALERSLRIREEAFGLDSLEVADGLTWLSSLLVDSGERLLAQRHLERALRVKQHHLGLHWQVAQTLTSLADLTCDLGDYPTGRALYAQALENFEASLDSRHPSVARGLHNLGSLHHVMGDVAQAFVHYERALEIRRQVFGDRHVTTAYTHANLAMLMRETGDFANARGHFRSAVEGLEQGLRKDHPHYAFAVSQLALLIQESGDYETAWYLHREALRVRQAAARTRALETGRDPDRAEEESSGVGESLAWLGGLALERGDHAQARELLTRALAIQERTIGPQHHDLRNTLIDLARLEKEEGDLLAARRLLKRVIAIFERYNSRHHHLVEPLAHLASIEADSSKALGQVAKGLAIVDEVFGQDHPRGAGLLLARAQILTAAGESRQALDSALRSADLANAQVRTTIRALAEREALRFADAMTTSLDLSLSLLAAGQGPPGIKARIWDSVIRSRALILDESIARHRMLKANEDPELRRLARRWYAARQRLTDLLVRTEGELSAAQQLEILRAARTTMEAEQAVAERGLQDRPGVANSEIGFAEVTEHLPPQTALVALKLFDRSVSVEESGTPAPRTVASYLAFVLRAPTSEPMAVFLGPAATIDAEVEVSRALLVRGLDGSAGEEAAYRVAGHRLRELVWDPLLPHLAGASQVFLVPDGSLHLVNMASLPIGANHYLIEEGPLLHQLTAERSLVILEDREATGRGLLAIGAADFDDRSQFAALQERSERRADLLPTSGLAALFATASLRDSCGASTWLPFSRLPETAAEIDEVSTLWRAAGLGDDLKLKAKDAREADFKRLAPGRRILHFATHGFFWGGDCGGEQDRARGHSMASPALTGLVLAGANFRQRATAGEEDGILASEEIAVLDLSGVEWAVLSACDTGVGEIHPGEGVFGLRRAFRVAGARTVIMSLWAVEDENAREWMKELYRGRILEDFSTAEAIRRASLVILEARRASHLSTHPAFWAAFVAAGDWR